MDLIVFFLAVLLQGWALVIPGIYMMMTHSQGRLLRPMRTYAAIHIVASVFLFGFSIWCSTQGGHQEAAMVGFYNVLLNFFFAVVYVMVLVSGPRRS